MSDPTGWVMRAVKKNRLGTGVSFQEVLNIVEARSESLCHLKCRQAHPRSASSDVRPVSRKMRTENEHTVIWINEGLAEQLLKRLGARSSNDICSSSLETVFFVYVGGCRLSEFL